MKFFTDELTRQKVAKLKSIPIFHELTTGEILEVDELLHERVFEKGETLFEENDPGHGIFIVISGKLRAELHHDSQKATIVEFGPGELVGELCLFDEGARTATVVAVERTTTVALFRAEFSSLLMKHKSIGVKVLIEIARIISRRARRLLLHQTNQPSL